MVRILKRIANEKMKSWFGIFREGLKRLKLRGAFYHPRDEREHLFQLAQQRRGFPGRNTRERGGNASGGKAVLNRREVLSQLKCDLLIRRRKRGVGVRQGSRKIN